MFLKVVINSIMNYDIDAACNWLQDKLTNKRYQHSLSVMKTSVELAERFGAELKKAEYAGLIHDCAKGMTHQELMDSCNKCHIEIDEVCMVQSELLHGAVSAGIAQCVFNVDDEDILNAIRYHTTGRKGMSILEKIIYVSDLIEPYREFPGVYEIRKAACNDLDGAVLKGIEFSLKRVIGRGNMIHPDSINAWNDMLRKQKVGY